MRSKDVLIPHIAVPFRFIGTGLLTVDVNEQDTLDDVYDCVQAIIRCPEGFRPELMGFGILDQTFTQGEIDLDLIRGKVSDWEERADVLYSQSLDGIGLMDDLVKARVASLTRGGSSA